jgi:hypothetical protein
MNVSNPGGEPLDASLKSGAATLLRHGLPEEFGATGIMTRPHGRSLAACMKAIDLLIPHVIACTSELLDDPLTAALNMGRISSFVSCEMNRCGQACCHIGAIKPGEKAITRVHRSPLVRPSESV